MYPPTMLVAVNCPHEGGPSLAADVALSIGNWVAHDPVVEAVPASRAAHRTVGKGPRAEEDPTTPDHLDDGVESSPGATDEVVWTTFVQDPEVPQPRLPPWRPGEEPTPERVAAAQVDLDRVLDPELTGPLHDCVAIEVMPLAQGLEVTVVARLDAPAVSTPGAVERQTEHHCVDRTWRHDACSAPFGFPGRLHGSFGQPCLHLEPRHPFVAVVHDSAVDVDPDTQPRVLQLGRFVAVIARTAPGANVVALVESPSHLPADTRRNVTGGRHLVRLNVEVDIVVDTQ